MTTRPSLASKTELARFEGSRQVVEQRNVFAVDPLTVLVHGIGVDILVVGLILCRERREDVLLLLVQVVGILTGFEARAATASNTATTTTITVEYIQALPFLSLSRPFFSCFSSVNSEAGTHQTGQLAGAASPSWI